MGKPTTGRRDRVVEFCPMVERRREGHYPSIPSLQGGGSAGENPGGITVIAPRTRSAVCTSGRRRGSWKIKKASQWGRLGGKEHQLFRQDDVVVHARVFGVLHDSAKTSGRDGLHAAIHHAEEADLHMNAVGELEAGVAGQQGQRVPWRGVGHGERGRGHGRGWPARRSAP